MQRQIRTSLKYFVKNISKKISTTTVRFIPPNLKKFFSKIITAKTTITRYIKELQLTENSSKRHRIYEHDDPPRRKRVPLSFVVRYEAWKLRWGRRYGSRQFIIFGNLRNGFRALPRFSALRIDFICRAHRCLRRLAPRAMEGTRWTSGVCTRSQL